MRTWKSTLLFIHLAILFAAPRLADACTAFSASTRSGPIIAKSFDWSTGDGWVVLNERGRRRRMLVASGSPGDAWTSSYSSISFTTIGPGFPISGANEAGLAIEALVDLSGSATAHPAPGRLTGLELVQYGLDRFASVGELADFVEGAGYSQLAISLHFFACDLSGACAVIERHRRDTKVTRDSGLAVRALANLAFAEELRAARPSKLASWFGAGHPTPGSSTARFQTVARSLEADHPADADGVLQLLEKVVTRGRTRWQIVWELRTGAVHFRRRDAAGGKALLHQEPKSTECVGAPRVRRIGRHGVEAAFVPWSTQDVADAERAVLAQLSLRHPSTRRLAAEVARATGSSACAAAQ